MSAENLMTDADELNLEVHQKIMKAISFKDIPNYCTDPRETLKVIKQLGKDGWFYGIKDTAEGVIVTLANEEGKVYAVQALAVPEAVCEAAVRTLA